MTEVSTTRLYLGNLPRNATKEDVQTHFNAHGTGEITEIKLMNGFGFIEYKDAMDARDVVPAFHGSDFMGERLTVQFARGSRPTNAFAAHDRSMPRPRRTPHRMMIAGLPGETSWQDLKDFARRSGLDVVYSETGRDRDGKGSFVEFETAADLRSAIEKLDQAEFKGVRVTCTADEEGPRSRYRSRSPYGRHGDYPPAPYERRGGPRGYTPPRRDYRARSPPPRRDYYDSRDRYRSPPRARGPPDDVYPPPRRPGYPDDPYDAPPPPRRGYEPDPYVNGHSRPYDRPPSPRASRPRSPPRAGYHDYDRRVAYW
ncbi:MAG: hypothetical protein M4579_000594 [Chaenotheca gracillima]|nr:MAG: hypothetical protein M4579_000594 [Chaenotheca gracillima]